MFFVPEISSRYAASGLILTDHGSAYRHFRPVDCRLERTARIPLPQGKQVLPAFRRSQRKKQKDPQRRDDGVVHPTEGSALRTFKMLAPYVFQAQFQALWFSLKATFSP